MLRARKRCRLRNNGHVGLPAKGGKERGSEEREEEMERKKRGERGRVVGMPFPFAKSPPKHQP